MSVDMGQREDAGGTLKQQHVQLLCSAFHSPGDSGTMVELPFSHQVTAHNAII